MVISFSVIDFNIDGFLKLSDERIKLGGYEYILQKNQVEFNTQWKVAIGADLSIFEIIAIYEPVNKLDFSKLASYNATQNYTFTDINNLKNEIDEINKVAIYFHQELFNEYNKRIKGTKLQIPFPSIGQQQLAPFCQQAISSLHKALERIRNLLKS